MSICLSKIPGTSQGGHHSLGSNLSDHIVKEIGCVEVTLRINGDSRWTAEAGRLPGSVFYFACARSCKSGNITVSSNFSDQMVPLISDK